MSDSAGVRIVHSIIGPDAATCGPLEELFRIGSVDADDGTALYDVRDVAFLGDGRVAVLNSGTSQVKLFSPTGDLLSEFGRGGRGPDEFKNLWSLGVRGGDTLVVPDYRPWRFSFFTPAGDMIRRVELRPAMIERPDFASALAAGSGFIVEEPNVPTPSEFSDIVVPLYRYDEGGAQTGVVADFWLYQRGYYSEELGYIGSARLRCTGDPGALARRPGAVCYRPARTDGGLGASMESSNRSSGGRGAPVRWGPRMRTCGDSSSSTGPRSGPPSHRRYGGCSMPSTGTHVPVEELYPGHRRVVVSDDGVRLGRRVSPTHGRGAGPMEGLPAERCVRMYGGAAGGVPPHGRRE